MTERATKKAKGKPAPKAEAPEKDDAPKSDAPPKADTAASDTAPAKAEAKAPPKWKRWAMPGAIYAVAAITYVAMLGDRLAGPSSDNHFVRLAMSFLHGQLSSVDNFHTDNDWALYDGKWFVSFPPFPAVVILPVVAIWKERTADRLFWSLLAGVAPAVLYVVLRTLRESGRTTRTVVQDVALTALFAFGTVYFFVAVQGTVWFAAQVVASALLALYVLFSLDAKRPLWAGLCLALVVASRGPSPSLGVLFFTVEALRVSRRSDAKDPDPDAGAWRRLAQWIGGVDWKAFFRRAAIFAAPVLVVIGVLMWLNDARFGSPFEFGHRYLQIRWLGRIEKWGLFNYHYLAKNLAVFTAGLPWLSRTAPHIQVNGHGLAFWVTTPALLGVLFPKKVTPTMVGLYLAAAAVCLWDLMYQNSGWLQFGYRFALDYMPYLIVLLALDGRKRGPVWWTLLVYAVAVNAFGAVTFDRAGQFYYTDVSQNVLYQPD